jgi:hypothetical protein
MSAHREPRRVLGYVDIGPITIPPRPRKPALVDRGNGNVYELVKSGVVPALSLLTDTTGFQVFTAHSGPYVQDGEGTRRLFSSAGALSSEAVSFKASASPVFITVTENPLDVWRVLWDSSAQSLTLEEAT